MTTGHRPLSDWIGRLDRTRPTGVGLINDGDERLDARSLPMFEQGWLRRTTVLDGRTALALQHPSDDVTYVELDDFGAPLLISDQGAGLIDRVEESWPRAELSPADLGVVAGFSRELRYLLLHRLDREGSPAPELFHTLPWAPVIEVAGAVRALLDGDMAPELSADAADLGPWVTPAAPGVTGPLEQVHEALTGDELQLAVIGGTSFCEGVRGADPARFPAEVASALADVAARLASINPFLRHAALLATEHLSGGRPAAFVADLTSELAKAAGSEQNRSHVVRLRDASPFRVETEVTAAGRLMVSVEVGVEAGPERDRLVRSYSGLFAPVVVRFGAQATRYWMALEARRRWVAGTLDVPCPKGRFQVEADAAPIGVWGLSRIRPEDLLPSLRGTNSAGRQVWRDVAERSPAGHPIRRAIREFDDGRGPS